MNGFFEYIHNPTARKLAEALASLMEEQSIDDISTSQILEVSGVSRSTFYRHYKDKYDLLNKNYQALLDQTVMQIPSGMSFKLAFYSLYQALKSYPSFFRNAFASRDEKSLHSYIARQTYAMYDTLLKRQGMDMDSSYNRLLLRGYIQGALEVTYQWVNNGAREPVDTLFRICYELLPHQIQMTLAISYM